MPVIQPSAPSSALSSAATLTSEQQCSGPLHGFSELLASCTSILTPKRSSNARHVCSVSSNSTPVSIVTILTAWGGGDSTCSSRNSSSISTDSSFWKEHSSTARRARRRTYPKEGC